MLRKTQALISSLVCITLFACSQQEDSSAAAESSTAEGWATVNGSPLNDAELEYAVNRFFGDQFVDARAVQNIRESLIASRAISQKASSALDADVLAQIDTAVQAYREERLITAYIESTVTPEPVSAQMVSNYYESHLEEFGAATIKRLDIIEATVTEAKRPQTDVSQQVYQLSQTANWSEQPLPNYIKNYQVASNQALPAKLKSALNGLNIDETSALIVEGDKVFVLKVLAIENIPAKPLVEVSARIRKRLAATQLSKTVKSLTEQILGESTVVRNF